MPEHESPYGQIRFSAQTVDGPGGRYTVLVGEGSQVVFATVKAVVIALAVAAPIVVSGVGCGDIHAGVAVYAIGLLHP